MPYGPSTVAPEDPKELEDFFERMMGINQEGKRPDLLLYDKKTFNEVARELPAMFGNLEKVAETSSKALTGIVRRAKCALEVENSLWGTGKMPGFGKPVGRYVRGRNKGRIKPAGVIPTIILKEEDIPRLRQWEREYGVPIYIVHLSYDRAYFIRFSDVLRHIESGDIGIETQKYSNPDGTAGTLKQVVKVPYILAREFGTITGQSLAPRTFVDKNGKVMTYVTFEGGYIQLSEAVLREWKT